MKHFARLRTLLPKGKADLDEGMKNLAKSLQQSRERALIQWQILSKGGDRRYWALELSGEGSRVLKGEQAKPDLEILTREENAHAILQGTISPLEVFGTGKMRIRGNIDLAKRLYKLLAEPDGITDIC